MSLSLLAPSIMDPVQPPRRKSPAQAALGRNDANALVGHSERFPSPKEMGLALRQEELRDNQTPVPLPFLVSNTDRDRENRGGLYVSQLRRTEPSGVENLLARYRALVENIDPASASAPSRDVERLLFQVLLRCGLMGFTPARVDISIEGGAIVQFAKGKIYADIELLNVGEVLASCSRPGLPLKVWALECTDPKTLSVSLDRLYAYIHGEQ